MSTDAMSWFSTTMYNRVQYFQGPAWKSTVFLSHSLLPFLCWILVQWIIIIGKNDIVVRLEVRVSNMALEQNGFFVAITSNSSSNNSNNDNDNDNGVEMIKTT